MTDEKKADQKKTRKRSPAYPAINLETAIARAKELKEKEHNGTINISVAVGHWGYTSKSSPGQRILSSLKQYGLIEDIEGSGKDRMLRLSKLALDIILDYRPESVERSAKIKTAALTPPIFQKLFDKWPHELPSNESLSFYLIRKEDFNPKAVNDLIEVWKETFIFAELSNDALLSINEGENLFEISDQKPPPLLKDKFMQPHIGYRDYTLSLGKGRDIILRAPQEMSSDDLEFMTQWLKRLNLDKQESHKQILEQHGTNEEKQEQPNN